MVGRSWRRQPPVATPITFGAIAAALRDSIGSGAADLAAVASQLAGRGEVILTDSGTSALVLALRAVAGTERVVAMPAYACPDLIAAAHRAAFRVVAYDVDPATLSVDMESLERVLARGADAVVVAHLFGIPADVPATIALAARYGAAVIEDAAQSAGGMLHDVPLGAQAPLAVLSFGRGKGTAGGGGGALIARDARDHAMATDVRAHLAAAPAGASTWARLLAQWMLGRPALYRIPSSVPGLRLGETVYHDAPEPRAISACSLSVLSSALRRPPLAVVRRRAIAAQYSAAIGQVRVDGGRANTIRACAPIAGSLPGYLRFPVLAPDGRAAAPELGVLRGYPRLLTEWPQARAEIVSRGERLSGARELVRVLLTLPTHHFVGPRDVDRVVAWLGTPSPLE